MTEFCERASKLRAERKFTGHLLVGLRLEAGDVASAELDEEFATIVLYDNATQPNESDIEKDSLTRFGECVARMSGLRAYGNVRASLHFVRGVVVDSGLLVRRTLR